MGTKPTSGIRTSSSVNFGHGGVPGHTASLEAKETRRRLGKLESTQTAKLYRQATSEADAQNFLLSLTTATRRLESGQRKHTHRMLTHEQVIEPQQAQAEAAIGTHQMNSKQACIGMAQNEEHIRNTQNTEGALNRRYEEAHQVWDLMQNQHGNEALRLRHQMQTTADPPTMAEGARFSLLEHAPWPPPPGPQIPRYMGRLSETAGMPIEHRHQGMTWGNSTNSRTTPPTLPPRMLGSQQPTPATSGYPRGNSTGASSVLPAPPLIDNCASFKPPTDQHWRRHARLRMAGFRLPRRRSSCRE